MRTLDLNIPVDLNRVIPYNGFLGRTVMQTCTYRWCQIKKPQELSQFVDVNGKATKMCLHCRERRKGYEITKYRKAGIEPKQYGGYSRGPIEGLTPQYAQIRRREENAQLLVDQEYKCAICSCDIAGKDGKGKSKAFLDHCHDSLKARGWLCQSCNTGLGHMQDSPKLLRAGADYLERFNPDYV